MADEDFRRRVERLEQVIDNGRFVRREAYEADVRAQERTDLAQEARFAAVNERIDENRDAVTWMQRQLIIMLFGIIAVAVTAALAVNG